MAEYLDDDQRLRYLCKREELQSALLEIRTLVTVNGSPVEAFGRLQTEVLQLAEHYPARAHDMLNRLLALVLRLKMAVEYHAGNIRALAKSFGQALASPLAGQRRMNLG